MGVRTLQLPRLVAGRDFAADLASTLGRIRDEDVIVDGSRLLSGTPSFAAELVHQILVDGKAHTLAVAGAPAEFTGYLRQAANTLGVADRLQLDHHQVAS